MKPEADTLKDFFFLFCMSYPFLNLFSDLGAFFVSKAVLPYFCCLKNKACNISTIAKK